jgi:hypothetical protein
MTKPLHPHESGDDWEALAGDLFGIDFKASGKDTAAGETDDLSFDDFEEDEIDEELLPPEDTPSAEEEWPAAVGEDKESIAKRAAEDSGDSAREGLVAEVDDEAEPEEPAEAAAVGEKSKEDAYWDALEDWNWDEPAAASQERSGAGRPPSRPRREERTRSGPSGRSSRGSADTPKSPPPPARPAPQAIARDEFEEDDEFAIGLLGEAAALPKRPRPAPSSETLAQAESIAAGRGEQPRVSEAAEADDESSRPRRRRRRRRGRRPEQESDRVAASGAAEDVEFDEPSADEDDAFAAAADFGGAEESPAEPAPPRERRSDRRRRRRPRRQEPAASTAPAESREAAEQPWSPDQEAAETEEAEDLGPELGEELEAELEEESSGEGEVTYRNIPTWEEAISYLTGSRRAERRNSPSEGASPGRPDQPGGSGSSSRPPGRRGRRRR